MELVNGSTTSTLEDIGEEPFNEYIVNFIGDISKGSIHHGYLPSGGFTGQLSKAELVGSLREALENALEVPPRSVCLSYEGSHLDDAKTLRDNGVIEPGAIARKRGQKISMAFMLNAGVETGKARRDRQEAEEAHQQAERERQAVESAKKKAEEDLRRHLAEEKKRKEAEEAAKKKREEDEAALQAAENADRITVRCRLMDGNDIAAPVDTLRSRTAAELAIQIVQDRHMGGDARHLHLIHNGTELGRGAPLGEAGVQNGDEIMFYLGD